MILKNTNSKTALPTSALESYKFDDFSTTPLVDPLNKSKHISNTSLDHPLKRRHTLNVPKKTITVKEKKKLLSSTQKVNVSEALQTLACQLCEAVKIIDRSSNMYQDQFLLRVDINEINSYVESYVSIVR